MESPVYKKEIKINLVFIVFYMSYAILFLEIN